MVEKSSDLKEIKQKWRTFIENYERKVRQEIRDNKDAEMFCKNCKRFILAEDCKVKDLWESETCNQNKHLNKVVHVCSLHYKTLYQI